MTIRKNLVRENFTTIPNDLITDNNLSMSAKVLYCYLASKPDNWDIWNKDISKALNIKTTNAIAKYLKELIETGWITRENKRSKDGKIVGGYDYTINVPNYGDTLNRAMPELGQNHKHNNTDIDTYNNRLNLNNTDISKKKTTKKKGFVKPTIEEIKAYCEERNNGIDAEYFYYKNEERGWVSGKTQTPIKNWKATIITWERTKKKWETENNSSPKPQESVTKYRTLEEVKQEEEEDQKKWEEYYRKLKEQGKYPWSDL